MKAYKRIAITLTFALSTSAPALVRAETVYFDSANSQRSMRAMDISGMSIARDSFNEVPYQSGYHAVSASDDQVGSDEPVTTTSVSSGQVGYGDVQRDIAYPSIAQGPQMFETGPLAALLAQLSSMIQQLTEIRNQAMASLRQAQGAIEGAPELPEGVRNTIGDEIHTAVGFVPFQPTPIIGDAFRFPNLIAEVPERIPADMDRAGQTSVKVVQPALHEGVGYSMTQSNTNQAGPELHEVVGYSVTQSNTNQSGPEQMHEGVGYSTSQSTSNTQKRVISGASATAQDLHFEIDPSWIVGEGIGGY